MTREETLRHIKINLITLYDIDENVIECNDAMEIIDKIFKDHEAQLKAKDEEIRRLNNLYADTIKELVDALIEIESMKHKTCKGCVHEVEDMQDLYCAFCSRSCDDNFEPKEQ